MDSCTFPKKVKCNLASVVPQEARLWRRKIMFFGCVQRCIQGVLRQLTTEGTLLVGLVIGKLTEKTTMGLGGYDRGGTACRY